MPTTARRVQHDMDRTLRTDDSTGGPPTQTGASEKPLQRHREAGLNAVTLNRPDGSELFLVVARLPGETIEAMCARAASAVRRHGGQVVSQTAFHLAEHRETIGRALGEALGGLHWPVTWVGFGNGRPDMVGMHLHAVRGVQVRTLDAPDGRTIGCTYEDAAARWCILGDLVGADIALPRDAQAAGVLEGMATALERAGMSFADVVRTWFFNDDILAWYDDFNRVRNAFFTERGVFGRLVPASTGIGARNPHGSALTAGVIAARPKAEGVTVQAVPSPLQCPALDYKSSFSRAAEITTPHHRWLIVSGTASIAPDGRTQYVGDVEAQVARTMEVVEAILQSRGMRWDDLVRGVTYVRNADDAPVFVRYCQARGIPLPPIVITANTVCRDDLLFEIEADAIVPA